MWDRFTSDELNYFALESCNTSLNLSFEVNNHSQKTPMVGVLHAYLSAHNAHKESAHGHLDEETTYPAWP